MFERRSRTLGKGFCIELLVLIENNAVAAGHTVTLDRWVLLHWRLHTAAKQTRGTLCTVCLALCCALRVECAHFVVRGMCTDKQPDTSSKMCLLQALHYGLNVGMLSP